MTRLYESLEFPHPPDDRPYVFINMVATVDGKTLTGERDEHVMDLGSPVDHQALRDLEACAQAVLVGAETVRSTPNIRYDNRLIKVVVTRSGRLPWTSRFFTDDPTRCVIAAPAESTFETPHPDVRRWDLGSGGDFRPVLTRLRQEGVMILAVEGGSELNAELIAQGWVDEYFLTIAPKLKLGREVPTYAGGEPLDRDQVRVLKLVSSQVIDDEVFLRYRRSH